MNERCAARADLRGDPLLGTAFPAARLLLVEQPGPWGFGGLRESRFPADVCDALLARAAPLGVRVQTIRRVGARPPGREARRWALVDTRAAGQVHWGSFHDPAELLDLPLEVDAPRLLTPGDARGSSPGPIYLVCTHGKHDPCCAVRGRPVAAELNALSPGQVWETSHVGGDRFAANVLILPSGILYGRVTPEAVADVVAAADVDDVLVPLLRGQVGVPPAAQAALAFVYLQAGLRRRQDARVQSTRRIAAGRVEVLVAVPTGTLRVTVGTSTVDADGLTCRSLGANRYVRYDPISIEHADP